MACAAMMAASRSMRRIPGQRGSLCTESELSDFQPIHSLPSFMSGSTCHPILHPTEASRASEIRSVKHSPSIRRKERHRICPILLPKISETLLAHGLELRDQIGSGGFGSVYTVWHTGYQKILVVKISDVEEASWLGEMDALKSIYHPNIVKLYDAFQDEAFGFMVLEYCSGGNLDDKIKATGPLPFREFRDIAYQLVDALSCCHAAGIAHLDLKPANVFFADDGKIRLGDFGCSRPNLGDSFFGGSRPFMSPEIVCQMGDFNKFQSDIWSLGVTFYFMASGQLPWRGSSSEAIKAEIRIGTYVPLKDVDPKIPPLIRTMLKLEPSQRPSLSSLLETIGSWTVPHVVSTRKVLPLFGEGPTIPGWRMRCRRPLARSFPEDELGEKGLFK